MNRRAWIVVIAACLVVSGLGLLVALRKDAVARGIVENHVAQATGLVVSMEGMEASLLDRSLRITGLELTNPESFEEREAFLIPLVYAQATWRTLLGLEQRLTRLHLRIEQVQLVRNADGSTNLDTLNGGEPILGGSPAPLGQTLTTLAAIGIRPLKQTKPQEPPPLRIDQLKIYIGSVRMVDHIMGAHGKPMTLDYALNEERSYENVTDLEQVVGEMVMSVALQALPQNLTTLLPQALEKLEESAPELMEGLRDFLKDSGSSGQDGKDPDPEQMLKDFLQSL